MIAEEFISRSLNVYFSKLVGYDYPHVSMGLMLWALAMSTTDTAEDMPFEHMGWSFNIKHSFNNEMDTVTCNIVDENKLHSSAVLVYSRISRQSLSHWIEQEHNDNEFALLRISTNYKSTEE